MNKNRYANSEALLARAKKVLAGGVSSEFRKYNHPHALFYSHGEGSDVYDADGNKYVDFTLSQGPLILGHSHPEVMEAITSYSSKGQLFAGQHIQEIELAEKIQLLYPAAELMRFCLDGSAAVQTAFRIARAVTGKKKFLRFEGHYHGWLDNVAWGISAANEAAAGSRENPNKIAWSQGLPETAKEEFSILPWNDLPLLENYLKNHHQDLAAIITEPVMCNSGCIEPQPGFLQGVRRLCNQYNILFILDEVITGFRLSLGGAQKYFDLNPDLMVLAKAIASGYPLSVIAGKKDYMQVLESGAVIQAGTMNAGNASVAAALATIRILEREDPYQRMFQLGNKCMDGLRSISREYGLPLLVQGPGPMFHTGFTRASGVTDFRGSLSYDKQKLGAFISGMHDEGIRIIGRGLWYISAAHTEEDIDVALDKAATVLRTI